MKIKKCVRCGTFITSEADMCSTCANKLNYSNTILKNFFDDVTDYDSISSVAEATGLSPTTVQDYMVKNNFSTPSSEIDYKNYYNEIPY